MYSYATHFAAETFVPITDADRFVETFGMNFREYILSSGLESADTVIDFGEGKAILRPGFIGLRIRIASDSLWGYLGCRELLHLHLFDAGMVRDVDYMWMPASDVPFAVPANRANHGRR
ncbi:MULTISPECIES: hypothetical protein [unclassified Shinella]|uniref:hypothetical protein n=1 Tax=unclassified Shinella TaxID=2643062 RepID=UPI00225D8863|nr:hypothetical protein [Shinella sp. YE25]MDC7259539.1 hypothetical protein [Shinella sp. YE25]CAI0341316.1 conserved hypothetical protein [Rhizobiaceae bacterium]CAK7260953.1 conserved protein of unknown function [Shinella sp. WSC3-e]